MLYASHPAAADLSLVGVFYVNSDSLGGQWLAFGEVTLPSDHQMHSPAVTAFVPLARKKGLFCVSTHTSCTTCVTEKSRYQAITAYTAVLSMPEVQLSAVPGSGPSAYGALAYVSLLPMPAQQLTSAL